MRHLRVYLRWLLVRDTPFDVAMAQLDEVGRHIVAGYALLLLNTMSVVYLHYRIAPDHLTIGVGMPIMTICIVQMLRWRRASLADTEDVERARQLLRRIVVATAIISASYVAWLMALDRYGNSVDRHLDLIFLIVNVLGCTFCLMHLPQAVVLPASLSLIPLLGFNAHAGWAAIAVMSAEIALAMVIAIHALHRNYVAFTTLIRSRTGMSIETCAAERLACENARIAHIDALTGLPNRRYFFAELDRMVATCGAGGETFAVGLLDLDRFKPINDTHGHAIGDRLLVALGERLMAAADDAIVIARLGGDEFGLLLMADDRDPVAIGQSFCDLIAAPVDVDDVRLSVGATCGMAMFPDAGGSGRELFDRCDYALYHGKAVRRGGCTVFTDDHELTLRAGQVMEAAMQTADLDRELDLHFQPIVDLASGRVVSVEALARWKSPVLGHVPPDQFIRIAESLGTMGAMTLILFRKALAHAVALPMDIGLSFNLSALDIASPETMRRVLAALDASDIDPRRIIFEITETAVIRDFDIAVAAIEPLRERGIRIALDDFGTGFSSLTHLHRLPLDRVKVDRSFAAGLADGAGHKVFAGIVALCRNLGLDCVIEGIETDDQLRRARLCGYRWAQGHRFGRAMPMADLQALLAADQPDLRATA